MPGGDTLAATEPGGHRWQRIPQNEKRGRVHTSTVTVAVLTPPTDTAKHVREQDVEFHLFSGSGPGGQNRNKTENCVRAVHRPTGIEAKAESERSLRQNKAAALAALSARVHAHQRETAHQAASKERRAQVGTGQRGDKVRTVRCQDGVVTCERTGRKSQVKTYLKGDLAWLT